MLSIQPNQISQTASKYQTFKGSSCVLDEETYANRRSYYENQKHECDELLEDQYLPKGFKNAVKVGKVVSEGILEGWAVAWAATKGAKFSKNIGLKVIDSKFAKNIAKMFGNLAEFVKVKSSPLTKKLGENFETVINKLDTNKYGKYVVKGLKAINNGFKAVKAVVTTVLEKLGVKNFTYEKATKATATTLGVGSGLAGAYNAGKENFGDKNIDNIDESANIEPGDEE